MPGRGCGTVGMLPVQCCGTRGGEKTHLEGPTFAENVVCHLHSTDWCCLNVVCSVYM